MLAQHPLAGAPWPAHCLSESVSWPTALAATQLGRQELPDVLVDTHSLWPPSLALQNETGGVCLVSGQRDFDR